MEKHISKTEKVKQHLIKRGHITSWEAIINYRATRLSAIIFELKKRGMEIESVDVHTVDKDGNRVFFTEYFYKNNGKEEN